MKKYLLFFFIISVALTALSGYVEVAPLRFIAKPLIMVFLTWGFSLHLGDSMTKFHKIILLGFFFSWMGDIFLLFDNPENNNAKLYFIMGLTSFLLAHVCYIISFLNASEQRMVKSFLSNKIYLIVPFVLITTSFLFVLFPHLGNLKIPVVIYGAIITLMVITALNLKGVIFSSSWQLIFIGAILFMVSDMTLAFNQFISSSLLKGIIVIITYGCAQYLIMLGSSRVGVVIEKS